MIRYCNLNAINNDDNKYDDDSKYDDKKYDIFRKRTFFIKRKGKTDEYYKFETICEIDLTKNKKW